MGILGTLWHNASANRRRFWRAVAQGSELAVNGALGERAERINPSSEGLEEAPETTSAETEALVDRWGASYDSAAAAVSAPGVRVLFVPDLISQEAPSLTWQAIEAAARAGNASGMTQEGLARLRTAAELFAARVRAGDIADTAERAYFERILPKLQRVWSEWVATRFPRAGSPPGPASPPPASPPPAASSGGSGKGGLVLAILGLGMLAARRRKR